MNHQLSRRAWLNQSACGFGALAATALAAESAKSQAATPPSRQPAAKRIIFLFMQGGVSQVDSFDFKPALHKRDGETLAFDDARKLAKTGQSATQHRLMRSPWRFRPYGQSGKQVSELFSKTAAHVDDICFAHAMHTEGVAHGPATLFLHCGSTQFVRPSIGSWVLHGLGSENHDLPGFISIAPSIGNGGPRNYGNAFLPASLQGTPVGRANADELHLANLSRPGSLSGSDVEVPPNLLARQRDLITNLNRAQVARRNVSDDRLDAFVKSYEMADRMQNAAPEVFDLGGETPSTLAAYGIDRPETRRYGRRCLLARRLCEAGVRFIQVNYGDNSANPAWDQHSNLPKHAKHAAAVDQPIAALLTDLKQRGLLDDTIVWWGSEFGRTPYSQDNGTGRDHNPGGFTQWLAGGGFRAGHSHGATDQFGFAGIEGKVHMHDMHATLLHQLGLDHEQLTHRHAGRDFRLTDVYGRVVDDMIE